MIEDHRMRRPVTYAIQSSDLLKLDHYGCDWGSSIEQAKAIANARLIEEGPQVIWVVHKSGEPYKLMTVNEHIADDDNDPIAV